MVAETTAGGADVDTLTLSSRAFAWCPPSSSTCVCRHAFTCSLHFCPASIYLSIFIYIVSGPRGKNLTRQVATTCFDLGSVYLKRYEKLKGVVSASDYADGEGGTGTGVGIVGAAGDGGAEAEAKLAEGERPGELSEKSTNGNGEDDDGDWQMSGKKGRHRTARSKSPVPGSNRGEVGLREASNARGGAGLRVDPNLARPGRGDRSPRAPRRVEQAPGSPRPGSRAESPRPGARADHAPRSPRQERAVPAERAGQQSDRAGKGTRGVLGAKATADDNGPAGDQGEGVEPLGMAELCEKAHRMLDQSLAIRAATLGEDHPFYARYCWCLLPSL